MNSLLLTRVLLFSCVAFSFPVAAVMVYGFGFDRQHTADGLSVIYGVGLTIAIFASLLPFSCIQNWSRLQRVESLVLVFLGMSYVTHLSWELGWLLFHEAIIASPDAAWSYTWWAYIDGGDARYANPEITLIVMELLSVTNGAVGMAALVTYLRSHRSSSVAVLIMMATAVVHLYSASLYYLTEILDGLPNVNAESFISLYIKFGLANSPWVIAPWFVFWWAHQKLTQHK